MCTLLNGKKNEWLQKSWLNGNLSSLDQNLTLKTLNFWINFFSFLELMYIIFNLKHVAN